MRHTARVRGVREKGKERDRDREPVEDSIYLACSKKDGAKKAKPLERKRGTSGHGAQGGDLGEIDVHDECAWRGQRQSNDCGDSCPVLSLSSPCRVMSNLSLSPGLPSGPDEEPRH